MLPRKSVPIIFITEDRRKKMLELPTAEYSGIDRKGAEYTGKLAYHIEGVNVYFACIRRKAPDIYNAAEAIVPVLEKLAGRPWQHLNLFSITTHNGSTPQTKGEYEVYRIPIEEVDNKLKSGSGELIDISANNRDNLQQYTPVPQLTGVDPTIFSKFLPIINDDVQE